MHMSVNRKYEVGKVYSINVSELKPNPEQPRKYFDEDEIKALVNSDGKSSRSQIEAQIKSLEKQMREAAKAFDFERAAELRDIILEAKANLNS